MGSSESKMVVAAPTKPEPAIKHSRVSDLIDPRSPSTAINRTPIQVGQVSKTACPMAFTDPRSPTIGISRTPVRQVLRETVGSFAYRLAMFLNNEAEGKVPEVPPKCLNDTVEEEEKIFESEELASTEPLLTPWPSHTYGSLAEHANLLSTPVQPPPQSVGSSSPFVLLEQAQVEVELETEVEYSLEEAEEARESPLHKRLSMSLITCHEGTTSSQIFAEVHRDSTSPTVPGAEVEPLVDGVDHSYALPSITVEPESCVEPAPLTVSDGPQPQVSQSEEAEPSSEETKELVEETSLPAAREPPTVPSPEQPQLSTGIRCPTFDSKSPSQVVFKPQWLGKGFGATGPRARRVQSGKGGSSPLAVHVAVKKVTNENKRQSGKLKQKGTEGRSPLQVLKGTNSPREQPKMKLKVSTPDKQRLGQMDRRVLAVSLDKENR